MGAGSRKIGKLLHKANLRCSQHQIVDIAGRLAIRRLTQTRHDYIRTARAKGLSETAVVLKHGVRGGLLPVIAYLGPATAGLLTGSFVIEKGFRQL